MKTDCLLINGPFLPGFSRESRSPAVTKSGTLYYPAWLSYACGYANQNGHNCVVKDCIADKLNFIQSIEYVKSLSPEAVLIYTSTPSIDADLKFAKAIKDWNSNATIILAGTHASACHKELIQEDQVDFIFRKEFDLTLTEFLNRRKSDEAYFDLKGVTFLNGTDLIINPDMPYIHDLDILPFASQIYKEFLTVENYYYGHIRYPMVSIFTSRGCNARCNYCLYPQTMFGNFRSRTPQNIAEEFLWIRDNLPQVKEVLIDDDTFTMNKAHAIATSKALIKVGNKLKWTCEARANLDYETLTYMKKAGCRLIVTGFESIDQLVLNRINKGITVDQAENFVRDARRAKIKLHGCFMAGNPGDTFETLNKTLNWALRQNFDTMQFFPLQVYPGTKAYDWAVANNYLKNQNFRDWVTDDGMHNMTITMNDTGFTYLDALNFCDLARKKFYLRPSFIIKKLLEGIFDPIELRKNVIGFINLRKHLFVKVSDKLFQA